MTFEESWAASQVVTGRVREMRASDVPGIASLHRLVFVDYFLTHMGQRFLERFYAEFVDESGSYGFVAVHAGRPVGFVIGTTDSAVLHNRFYRRNLGALMLIVLERLLTDSYVRRNIMSRMMHIRRAFCTLFYHAYGGDSTYKRGSCSSVPARLLSIGVAPDFRGQGVADRLVCCLFERLRQDGVECVGLSVRPDNARAIAFYKKTGWEQERVTDTATHFRHSIR
jgi:ribosomal protein S18 acetylase RimI-like enzyme